MSVQGHLHFHCCGREGQAEHDTIPLTPDLTVS